MKKITNHFAIPAVTLCPSEGVRGMDQNFISKFRHGGFCFYILLTPGGGWICYKIPFYRKKWLWNFFSRFGNCVSKLFTFRSRIGNNDCCLEMLIFCRKSWVFVIFVALLPNTKIYQKFIYNLFSILWNLATGQQKSQNRNFISKKLALAIFRFCC